MNNGRRYSLETKNRVRQLRQEGKTHREIAKICGISFSSAHLWTKKIILTKEQKEAIEKRRNKPKFTPARKYALKIMARKILKKFWDKKSYSKRELLQKIGDFHKKENRIPLKREFNMYRVYQRRFGSWNNAILAAGLEPNEVIFSKKFAARDGHVCDSFAEKIIDDYLSENCIPHERNVYYKNTKMSADFLVEDVRIEYFGLAGIKKDYDQNIEKKRLESRKHRYKLLEIYPSALFAPGFKKFFIKNLRRWIKT